LRTSNEQKLWLLQQMQQDIANGFLDSSDAAMLINTHNVKQAMMIWAYKVKKAKQAKEQAAMAQIEANNRGASEAAQVAGQIDMQKMQMDYEMKTQSELAIEEARRQTMREKVQLESGIAQQQIQGKVMQQQIANQGSIQKQIIANQKQSQSE
jgi:hypothetical protein